MSIFWSQVVHGLTPYVPGEQPRSTVELVKLNTNENPYPPSPRALDAIRAATDATLRLYPDPTGLVLREAVARRSGLPASQSCCDRAKKSLFWKESTKGVNKLF